ncbi:MAG: lactate utilization protein C [Phycisphaerae bacterium]|nr:LUD domain-containing protein [Tepidisphaeraceae bacterium]
MPPTYPEDVLSRVRRSLGRTAPLTTPPVPPTIIEHVTRLVHSDIGLPELFARRAADNKMHPEMTAPEDVAGKVVELLKAKGLTKVMLPDSPLLERLGVAAALRAAGLDVKLWSELTLDSSYEMDVAVTDVTWAIAETGSLVIKPSASHGRAISLVPPVHVAIVEPKNCVADLIDLMDTLNKQGVGRNVTIITGPSKTADIEGALVVGVHGPGEVYTFVLQ